MTTAAANNVPIFVEKAEGINDRTAHYDGLLTEMSLAIQQEKEGFVCGSIFNHMPTDEKTAVYARYPQAWALRQGFSERADNTAPGTVTWDVKFDQSYLCKVYAARMAIGRQLKANASRPVDPERDTLDILVEHALIFKDLMWVKTFFKDGVWGTDLTGVAGNVVPAADEFVQFDDYANSDPIVYVDGLKDDFREANGREANKMCMGRRVFTKLKNHPKLRREAFGPGSDTDSARKISKQIMAGIFGVDEIVVAEAIYDAGNQGAAVAPQFIAGKHLWLGHSPRQVNQKAPIAGGYFSWTGYNPGANNLGYTIDKWEDRNTKTMWMEMEMAFDMKVVAAQLGVFLKNAVA